jgi:two-component system, chemotaxis family, sensor kinase Cph1
LVGQRTKIENIGPIDCSRVLEESLAYLAVPIQESGATVTHDSLPTVIAEELPLTLLFQNLIGNAIKYRSPGAPPRIHLSAQRSAAAWRISVTEYAGTGLGLAMCHRVVERYRGQIWVESKYDKDRRFTSRCSA